MTPANSAPIAYPGSRHGRYTPTAEAPHVGCTTSPIHFNWKSTKTANPGIFMYICDVWYCIALAGMPGA